GMGLAGTRFGSGQGRSKAGQEPNGTLLLIDGETASHLGESRLFGTAGPLCPTLKKHRQAGPKGWEIVSRHDIGKRLAIGRDCFGAVPQNPACGSRHSPSLLKLDMLMREEPEVGGVTGAIEPDAEPDPRAFEVPHRVDTALRAVITHQEFFSSGSLITSAAS